jgi:hypothetical protein
MANRLASKAKRSKNMSKRVPGPASEVEIFSRIVDSEQPFLSPEAARAIMRLDFSRADKDRMNQLAARNR